MTVRLTHANTKEPLLLSTSKFVWAYRSKTNGCTHIIADIEGGILPVTETLEQLERLLNQKEKK